MRGESRALTAALARLLGQDGDLPASRLSPNQARALDAYGVRTGAVTKRVSGSGQAYSIRQREAAELALSQLQPIAPAQVPAGMPQRTRNIATARHSKAGRTRLDAYHLVMRPVGAGARWQRAGCDAGFEMTELAAQSGLAAVTIAPDDDWSTDGHLWLVENQLVFDDLSWVPRGARGSVAYYGGVLDGRLLRWLSTRRRHAGLTLFADYDGVGLQQFARVAATTPNQDVDFWLMPSWEELLRRFGSPTVWANTRATFDAADRQLRGTAARERVAGLMDAMQRHGLALEQEAIWLGAFGPGGR